MPLVITSPAFVAGGRIPAVYTCDAENISPPLAWEGLPEGTRSLALIVEDPDAPDPAKPLRIWAHWVLFNIPPAASGLPEGVSTSNLPTGTQEGLNDWKRTGYGGPCPPVGRHRYFHRLFALDTVLAELIHPTKAELEQAMKGHVLEEAELMGTYQRG